MEGLLSLQYFLAAELLPSKILNRLLTDQIKRLYAFCFLLEIADTLVVGSRLQQQQGAVKKHVAMQAGH